MKRRSLNIFVLLLCPLFFAESQDVKFERISLAQGLSQTSVFSIAQDRQGFMWFATQDGLNRYDGYSFFVYRHNPLDSTTLSDNYVTVVMADQKGGLWVGTRGGGLNRYVPETGRFVRYRTSSDLNSLSHDNIRCLTDDGSGGLWIGTGNGLNHLDPATGVFRRYLKNAKDGTGIPSEIVESLYRDGNGIIWVGMLRGFGRLDPVTRVFTSIALPRGLSLVTDIREDQEKTLWIAGQDSLFTFRNGVWDLASRRIRSAAPIFARKVLVDSKQNIWFGFDWGLTLFRPTTRKSSIFRHNATNPQSLTGNSILSLFEDRTGSIWIGTFDGISKYTPAKFKFDHINWSTADVPVAGWNKVRGFCEDKTGTVWVATQEGLGSYGRGGLGRFPTASWYPGFVGTRLLWTLHEDGQSPFPTIWVGTNGIGLVKLEVPSAGPPRVRKYTIREGEDGIIIGGSVVAIEETRDGSIWAGSHWDGLFRFDKRTGRFARFRHDPADHESLSSNEIWALHEDRSGTLWVGTGGGGLNKMDMTQGSFSRFTHDPHSPETISDNKVLAVEESEDGILWLGTYGGLNRFDPSTGTFKRYAIDDGLPNNVIYGIVNDRLGNLWLTTNKGLSKFAIATETFRNYDAGDGLQSDEFNHGAAFRSRKGEIYVGGVGGFNVFRPENIVENTNIPQVVFTDIKVFNTSLVPSADEQRIDRPASLAEELRLSYADAVFSIEFAALEFTNTVKNQYAYKLEGFDEEWRPAGHRREAVYTNLDPGEYLFRVKASNSDGVWNEEGASMRIIVSPPFWGTWWFRGLIILGFLSIGPFIYYRRVSDLKQKQMAQQEFSRRLLEEQERERQRIAGELHDSLGQDLLVVKNRAKLGLRSSQRNKKAMEQFEEISGIVTKTLQGVREISHNLRPYQLDRLGLSDTLRSVLENVRSSSKIRINAQIDDVDALLPPEAEINVFRIIQEGMNNILKHSKAKEADIIVARADGRLAISMKDNGRGFSLAAKAEMPSFGLVGIHQRVALLGGTCLIDSLPGRGTKIIITVPLQNAGKT